MKNLLVLSFLFMISMQTADAYTITTYGNPYPVRNTYYQGNTYPVTPSANQANPYNFGSNAMFTPENRAVAGERLRQREYEEKYMDSLKDTKNINVNINTDAVIPHYNPYQYGRNYYGRNYNIYNPNRIIIPNRTYNINGIRIPASRMF